jgi:hypothetical protein
VFTFNGYCALKKEHTITWDFGDAKGGTGVTVTHQYATLGAHDVHAKCVDTDGKTLNAEIVVVTMDNPPSIPKNPTQPVLPPVPPVINPTQPTLPPGTPPTQKPNQGTQQQPTQGSDAYDPYNPGDCPCTVPDTTYYYPSETYYTPY